MKAFMICSHGMCHDDRGTEQQVRKGKTNNVLTFEVNRVGLKIVKYLLLKYVALFYQYQ